MRFNHKFAGEVFAAIRDLLSRRCRTRRSENASAGKLELRTDSRRRGPHDRIKFVRLRGMVVLLAVLGCGGLFNTDHAQAARHSLFVATGDVPHPPLLQAGSFAQPGLFSSASRWRPVQITAEVNAHPGVAVDDELVIAGFQDTVLTAAVDRVTVDGLGTKSIRGRIMDWPYGHLSISSRDGQSLANIIVPEMGLHYAIAYVPEAESHYLIDLGESSRGALECEPMLAPPVDHAISMDYQAEDEEPALGPDDPAEIDVMIVYTPAAREWAAEQGGIDLIIAQAMEHAQLALDNSATLITLRLVHAAEVAYVECGDSSVDLRRLTWQEGSAADPDGAMDEVHAWRDAYGADLVALFALLDDVGGRGWLLTTSRGQPQYAFSMTRVQQAATHDTHIHEMAHNMGAHHHKDQNVSPGPNSALCDYSAGWRWVGTDLGRYCSIMTYESGSYFADGLTHRRVPLFSNPALVHAGKAAGDAVAADNARTLRESKHIVAAYRYRPSPVHSIAGYVRTPDGMRIGGVLMDGLPGQPTTDEDGRYSAQIPTGWSGEVTPIRSGYLFEPPRRAYFNFISDKPDEDFTGWECDLGDAVDWPDLAFSTGGHAVWSCQNDVTQDGADAAGSGAIFHNQEVWMDSTVIGPGQLSFFWKVSSQADFDPLEFLIDGERYDAISGEVDWHPRTYEFPPGARNVRWRYLKDESGSQGADRAWIDQLRWIKHFTINVSASPPEGGSVFGGGIYVPEAEVSLSAASDAGFDFLDWMEDGQVVSAEVDYSFPATADRELTARFELKHYTLTYTAGTGGAIQGDGSQSIAHGENGTPVMAVPNVGHYFVQWSDGLETATREDVNVTGPLAVEGLFGINHYALNGSASPPEGGSVFGAGTYAHGTEATLAAVPSTGYDFVDWIENGQVVSTEAAYSFPTTSSRDLAARFDLKRYTLTYTAETGGAIQGAAFQTVTHGESGTAVVAVPEEGYRFIKWSDGLQTATREDVTVTGVLAVEARFAILEYTVSLSAEPPEGGTVFGGGTHRHETEASLSAVPNTGYDFVAWMENDQTVFGGTVYVFTATADRELVALFELKRYTLTYTAQTGGTIAGDTLQTVTHGGSGTAVVAVPDPGYHFVQWTDGLQTATREDVHVAGGLAVEAEFAIKEYTLSLSTSPPEGGAVFGGGVHRHGAEVSLSAVPNAGYDLVGWMENEEQVFSDAAYGFTATADRELVALFELKRYTLTYTAQTGGTIAGDTLQTVTHGGSGTAVVAVPDPGYHFVQWTDGLQTATREDVHVAGGLAVEAKFAINEYTLSLSASPPEGGAVLGGGVHPHGNAVSLSAVPNAGYAFVSWIENEQEVFDGIAYVFAATVDRELIARFELKRYTLTYTAGPGGSIQGDEMQSVTHGETGTAVVAVADAGADFDGWSDGFQTATRRDMGGPEDLSVLATFRSSGGVSIDWYTTHGISPGEGQTWTDLDHRDNFGKGMTLRDEYIADTDPADPNSVFRIVAVEPGPPFRIHFEPGSTRRLYTLQSTTDFLSESWTNVPGAAPRPGNGGVDNLDDTEPASSRFYRILVELP